MLLQRETCGVTRRPDSAAAGGKPDWRVTEIKRNNNGDNSGVFDTVERRAYTHYVAQK
jgi:hypothetical protein